MLLSELEFCEIARVCDSSVNNSLLDISAIAESVDCLLRLDEPMPPVVFVERDYQGRRSNQQFKCVRG